VESTLVLLNQVRAALERYTVLAAPPRDVLEYALDKARTLRLARELGVPAPRTAHASTLDDLLRAAAELRFPVAVKPRGPALHPATRHHLGFKVRYVQSRQELERLLRAIAGDPTAVLVQELARGVGHCVSALARHGEALSLFAYSRDREVPHQGGISVVRRSIAMDPRLAAYVRTLLGAIRWHGIAMVEFKYDPDADAYSLMEINGRFQASAALSLDAGLNSPHGLACLYTGRPVPHVPPYRVGVRTRWLRGDMRALYDAILHRLPGSASRWRVVADFCRDFRWGMHYDEFTVEDWGPGVVEAVSLAMGPAIRLGTWIARALQSLGPWRRRSTAASTPMHRAIRP
ncbi:MAG TPA: ATP-grasp domain-containing protein, partial [Gemmatimonadales bacterium]